MKIALLSQHYLPQKNSCAVQMKDLAHELYRLGHEPTVITLLERDDESNNVEKIDNIEIFRIPVFKIKDTGNISRAINEIILPICMIFGIKKSNISIKDFNAIIWYSPTIFFGPVVKFLKNSSNCPTYLILRDIFPEWALDLGLLKKNLPYFFFKCVAMYQYSLANIIGVQSQSNLKYFENWIKKSSRQLEVLNNWMAPKIEKKTSISFDNTNISGRKIFVYIGNMGIAQGMDVLIELANSLKHRTDIGFLFVGRGSEVARLKTFSVDKNLNNILFLDEIDSTEIPSLLKMCHVGLVALDLRHKTHNIPGKFLSYLQAGLPVLARVNPGTDLEKFIHNEKLGFVYTENKIEDFKKLAEKLINDELTLKDISERCYYVNRKIFSSELAAKQIIASLSKYI
jgi:glycosyltransferase involved in cell wall biosynthesis